MAHKIAVTLMFVSSAKAWLPSSTRLGLPLRSVTKTWSSRQDISDVKNEVSASNDSQMSVLGRRSLLGGAGTAAAAIAFGLPDASLAAASPAAYVAPSNNLVYRPEAGSLTGKTVLITGANTGLGLESAKRVLAAGASVIITARSQGKVDSTLAKLKSSVDESGSNSGKIMGAVLDLASLESVKSFPSRLEAAAGSKEAAVDVLLNNAGVMAIPERTPTEDGFERTVGVNHLGHFALTAVLLPALMRAKEGFRVVTVSSEAHRFASAGSLAKAIDSGTLETGGNPEAYNGWGAYGISKGANVLFTEELQRRLNEAGIKGSAVCLHPGAVQTDLARYITNGQDGGDVRLSEVTPISEPKPWEKFLKGALDKVILPIDIGANTQVFLAAGSDVGGDYAKAPPALYFDGMKPAVPTGASTDPATALKLWEVSEKLTGTPFLDTAK